MKGLGSAGARLTCSQQQGLQPAASRQQHQHSSKQVHRWLGESLGGGAAAWLDPTTAFALK